MQKQNIRTLSLVVATITYLIFGAALFDRFESAHETMRHKELNKNISIFKEKYTMNDTEFNQLWNNILMKKPYGNWKFIGSLYFCTVVVTLIGYGHSTPKTVAGKSFCIFYTLVGIPFFLIMFQSVGERLNSIIVFLLSKIKKRLKFKNQEIDMFELITVEFILTITIVLFASYVFVKNENWSYFDSIYYCLITLLTIGFGDLVPMQKNNALSNDFTYVSFTILFILTGLTTLASSMNLLVLRLATINAEEQVLIKMQLAEAQAQQCFLHGDVINQHKLFKRSDDDSNNEKPEAKGTDENVSVCSCACLDNRINNGTGYCYCCCCCCFPTRKKVKSKNRIATTKNQFLSYFYESSIVKRLGLRKRTNKQKTVSLNRNTKTKRTNSNTFELNNTNNEKEFSIVHISSSHSVKSFEF